MPDINKMAPRSGRILKEDGSVINIADAGLPVQLTGSNVAEGIADYELIKEGALLAESTRVATAYSPLQQNRNARGVMLFINVTDIGEGGFLTPRIRYHDPISGRAKTLNQEKHINTVGSYVIICYPGIVPSDETNYDRAIPITLPRTWSAGCYQPPNISVTYSISYSLIL